MARISLPEVEQCSGQIAEVRGGRWARSTDLLLKLGHDSTPEIRHRPPALALVLSTTTERACPLRRASARCSGLQESVTPQRCAIHVSHGDCDAGVLVHLVVKAEGERSEPANVQLTCSPQYAHALLVGWRTPQCRG
jgi:hypothetical protein